MKWTIYYDDGSTHSDDNGWPKEDGIFGVQVIAQYSERVGRQTLHGRDFYICINDCWWGVDQFGLLDWILHKLHDVQCVVAGRMMPNDGFEVILERAANEDNGLPRKSGQELIESPRVLPKIKV